MADLPKTRIGVALAGSVEGRSIGIDPGRLEAELSTLPAPPSAVRRCGDPADPATDASIVKFVQENRLEALVLAAGSERTVGCLLASTSHCLAPGRLAVANLLEHCSLAHADPAARIRKARALVSMAMARVASVTECSRETMKMCGRVLVMGAGPAGLSAALELSELGHEVVLVESRDRVAAILVPAISDLAARARERSALELLPHAQVTGIEGRPGDLRARIATRDGRIVEREVGAVIVATGVEHPEPAPGGGITGLSTLESMLHHGGKDLPSSIGIHADPDDVGEALAERAISHARRIRAEHGQAVSVFTRNVPVRSPGGQAQYDGALEAGVVFYRPAAEGIRTSAAPDGSVVVTGTDTILGRPFEVGCESFATSLPAEPGPSTTRAASLLGLEIEDGACLDPGNVTFRSTLSARTGILVAGACGGSERYEDSMRSGRIAALKAHELLRGAAMRIVAGDVTVDRRKCVACLTCVRVCPWSAARLGPDGHFPGISDLDCKDCGLCAAACPQVAIRHASMPERSIVGMGRALVQATGGAGAVLALACSRSGWAAADEAGALGLELPPQVHIARVPCAGIVGERSLLELLEAGVERVIVLACPEGNCENRRGSTAAMRRVEFCRRVLKSIGDDPDRIVFRAVASNMPHELAKVLAQVASVPGGSAAAPAAR